MFSIIRTGLDAANRDLAVISNNIANAGTNGFKKSEAQFEDLYHSQHNNSTEKATGTVSYTHLTLPTITEV